MTGISDIYRKHDHDVTCVKLYSPSNKKSVGGHAQFGKINFEAVIVDQL